MLNRFRNILSTTLKMTIYKTSILPYVTDCSTVWYFAKSSDLRKIERVQEKALRIIYCDKSSSYEKLLKTANLPTLQNRRIQVIAILMYKVKHGLVPEYISNLFEKPDQHYALRNNDFVIPRFRTVVNGKHSIRHFGPRLWSKLSMCEREKPSLNSFRTSLRKLDLTNLVTYSCNGQCKYCNE